MPRSFFHPFGVVALLLASSFPALADDLASGAMPMVSVDAAMIRQLQAARAALRTQSAAETTYVGYSPSFAGSNYWSIGTGNYRPGSSNPNDFGLWDWDHPVHGDSLQGWWPNRRVYVDVGGLVLSDDQRPWWAIDIGNNANYVIAQGPGFRRTTGVVGVWHRDPGGNGSDGVGWTPLSGSYSLWCGLRRENDFSQIDPITGNPFNGLVLVNSGAGSAGPPAIGTAKKWPGYGSQWDQMAYRDVDVSSASTITLRFKLRTNMSTAYGTNSTTRTGWFDKDPYAVTPGNFISSSAAGTSSPVDSFMVYLGGGVRDSLGVTLPSSTEYAIGSDGATHPVFDRQRRYFSEVMRIDRPIHEVFTTYGDHAASQWTTATIPVDAGWGGRARIVLRSKTNRGFDDETGSQPGAYSSGGAGAAVVDDIEVNLGSGFTSLGNFETPDQVNNDLAVSALDAWKTTGKPPGTLAHVHDVATLVYQDVCGPVDSPVRICNLQGNVISIGDHDHDEAAGGAAGTPERERNDEFISPAIGLRSSGGTNAFGINSAIASSSQGIFVAYDVYPAIFDLDETGNLWQYAFQAWPAKQSDGQLVWSSWGSSVFNYSGDRECVHLVQGGKGDPAMPRWSTADAEGGSVYPDSLRIRIQKEQACFRFSVTLNCSATDGGYFDNVALAFIDVPVTSGPDLSADVWALYNDTFPVNGIDRSGVPPGSASFDTTTALVKIGQNIVSTTTGNTLQYNVPGDTAYVYSNAATRVDLVFRIAPGPGNYVSTGVPGSGLRKIPVSATPVDYADGSNDGNFWAEYLRDNGTHGTPGGHPAGATNGGRDWSPLVWNSARCDSAEINLRLSPSQGVGGPFGGQWAAMYHESDPKFTKLGLAKNRCFIKDPAGFYTSSNITCDIAQTVANWPVTAGYVAENGLPLGQTYEYTKILPDGQFTPGTHVEYFFRAEGPSGVTLGPDTSAVYPQTFNGSLDGRRWEEFSVLPDAWKKAAYGGLGQACLLFVDHADRRGSELGWVSAADSTGATSPSKFGAHNGWHAPGTGAGAVNDPANFVRNRNAQAGTTWDLYQVKGGEGRGMAAGTIGSAYSNHAPSVYDAKWSFEGPSSDMLRTYYSIVVLSTGDLDFRILGPYPNQSSDDTRILREFLQSGTSGSHRGLWVSGSGFVEDAEVVGPSQQSLLHDFLKTALRDPSYVSFTGNTSPQIDVLPQTPIAPPYTPVGLLNDCKAAPDVLTPLPGGQLSSVYSPAGSSLDPVVAGVFHDVNPGAGEYWQSQVDGFDFAKLGSQSHTGTQGRNSYFFNLLANEFGKVCLVVEGCPLEDCGDVPNGTDPLALMDFMGLRNSPLRFGSATVDFGLAKPDHVIVSVYDITGRLVRTLADRRFDPGRQSVIWDGLDSKGVPVRRGVYFARVRYQERGFDSTKKLIVLK